MDQVGCSLWARHRPEDYRNQGVHITNPFRAIVGDMNQTTDALDVFAHLRQWGWVEAQEYAYYKWGRQIQPTYRDTSTIDHMWLSPELATKLTSVKVDGTIFADHACLYATFDPIGPYESIPVWPQPMAIPWNEVVTDELILDSDRPTPTTMQAVMEQLETSVDRHLAANKQAGLLQQQKGRCRETHPVWTKHPVAPPKRSRKHDVQIEYQGEHWRHTKWLRQVRRLQSLCRVLEAEQPTPKHTLHMPSNCGKQSCKLLGSHKDSGKCGQSGPVSW